jgi:four helix bundle protein
VWGEKGEFVKDFKELKVWTKAHQLALHLYTATRDFPRQEVYGLTSQMRRAAVSIAANIAEGCGRRSDGELARFLQIARGSASELEYHLLLARDLGFLNEEEHQRMELKLIEVQRMLPALVQRVHPLGDSRALKANRVASS